MALKQSRGIVYLVGAGPGDPGLLTVRGEDLLGRADVVVYDYLANPELLSYCAAAEKIYVGKKAAEHSMGQEQINQLLVDLAKQNKRVVRLKGGDPFVFGRGGEEAEALVAAKIPFEVVPGITAAIAAPAYAGIPVTHRDFNSSFTLITGHEKEEEYKDAASRAREQAEGSSDLDWSVIAKLPCVAFYMGVKSLPRICAKLIENGKSPDTPAATIQWGTRTRQRTCVATLKDLPEKVIEQKISAPAITIVGKVVTMRESINWFETRPLFGQTIVVTRTRQQASELSVKLQELGANVIEAPTIELQAPSDWQKIDDALGISVAATPASPLGKKGDAGSPPMSTWDPAATKQLQWDWVIFTSANGVRYTRDRLRAVGRDVRVFGDAKIAAIGDATAAAIQKELSLHVDLCPESFVAEALANALAERGQIAGKRFLLLRADIARTILREKLQVGGAAEVRDVAIYETKSATALPQVLLDALAENRINWITFTSSSTAKNFVSLLGGDYREKLKHIKLASIGPITTTTLRELGLEPATEAEVFNIDGLIAAISKPVE
ncbi:MAG TPA: uroporphyrinogen-III C-methyltransferase [Tepidisphaeraceae bacterium]|nr:uroporphyrinogen-III C-methyltransferase [Tepidisphaeraceae bacterium]